MKRHDHAKARAAGWQDPLLPQQPLVTVRWLLGALAGTILLAAVCGYAVLCLLFYQGSWQLIYQPSHTITTTPATAGIAFNSIRFDATETGELLLAGWWTPAVNAPLTVVLLHDEHGSISAVSGRVEELHRAGVNVLAFDYRGFGQSAPLHPSERSMNEDADAAWTYLVQTRHVPAKTILFYGVGTGAAIAAEAAARHSSAAGMVLDQPGLPALELIARDSRSKLLPVRLLTTDRLEPAAALAQSGLPKLFLSAAPAGSRLEARARQLFAAAGPPKEFATSAQPDDAIRKFFATLAATHSERR
ncbi:MAG: alpha/beta hydrolase [Acidobacteria bacterium]|nr:alpha/beta hydrolase [Acidobacteriota bacterium]